MRDLLALLNPPAPSVWFFSLFSLALGGFFWKARSAHLPVEGWRVLRPGLTLLLGSVLAIGLGAASLIRGLPVVRGSDGFDAAGLVSLGLLISSALALFYTGAVLVLVRVRFNTSGLVKGWLNRERMVRWRDVERIDQTLVNGVCLHLVGGEVMPISAQMSGFDAFLAEAARQGVRVRLSDPVKPVEL